MKYNFRCRYFGDALKQVEEFPIYSYLLRGFIISRYWILSNAFSVFIEVVLHFGSFILLMCYNILVDFFLMLNKPLISGINSTWSWCIVHFMCCKFGLLTFNSGILCLCSWDISSVVCFSHDIFVWLQYRSNTVSQAGWKMFPLTLFSEIIYYRLISLPI